MPSITATPPRQFRGPPAESALTPHPAHVTAPFRFPRTAIPAHTSNFFGDNSPGQAMSTLMTDDAIDLAAARSGDAAALGRLYDRHAGVILSLCRRRSGGLAEDAVQETFIRAFSMLDRVDDGGGLRPWLYAIARRVCAEHARAARRRDAHEEQFMVQAAALRMSPPLDAAAERREALDRLGAALDQLPEDERLAIHLFYMDSDCVAAAAEALNVSRSGFYKLLQRARARLAVLMKEVPLP